MQTSLDHKKSKKRQLYSKKYLAMGLFDAEMKMNRVQSELCVKRNYHKMKGFKDIFL